MPGVVLGGWDLLQSLSPWKALTFQKGWQWRNDEGEFLYHLSQTQKFWNHLLLRLGHSCKAANNLTKFPCEQVCHFSAVSWNLNIIQGNINLTIAWGIAVEFTSNCEPKQHLTWVPDQISGGALEPMIYGILQSPLVCHCVNWKCNPQGSWEERELKTYNVEPCGEGYWSGEDDAHVNI